MANKGSLKDLSVRHENFVARHYEGMRSASSGAADTDAGDVRCLNQLIECKMTGGPGKDVKIPRFIRQLEKIAEEAWEEGRIPALALRFYDPESVLADKEGWIDIIVRRVEDEA